LGRHFLTFFVVTVIASVPGVLWSQAALGMARQGAFPVVLSVLGAFLGVVFWTLSQAILLFGAFQDMRGRPVDLTESLKVGFRRFFPIIGVAISVSFLAGLASLLLVVPGLILFTMWFVATPACVVEQLGVGRSMRRSSELTKGHRWKIFGLFLAMILVSLIGSAMIEGVFAAVGGTVLMIIGTLIWNGIWTAFYAIAAAVAYHDLRVAKEGIDIEQIASVFD
jgi:hypothetical protein